MSCPFITLLCHQELKNIQVSFSPKKSSYFRQIKNKNLRKTFHICASFFSTQTFQITLFCSVVTYHDRKCNINHRFDIYMFLLDRLKIVTNRNPVCESRDYALISLIIPAVQFLCSTVLFSRSISRLCTNSMQARLLELWAD